MNQITRRRMMKAGLAAAAGLTGAAVGLPLMRREGLIAPDCQGPYGAGEMLTYAAQRLLTRHSMAREFSREMISKSPFANQVPPLGEAFHGLQRGGFRDWRLTVDGMVARPTSFSLSDLKALPMRSQITEIACEEGWSYIAEWIGTPLIEVLHECGILPQAKFVMYFPLQKDPWESIDMADALHPQTLITWGMNDGDLPIGFGGPLRLRVPRQLGYKSVKYLAHLIAVDSVRPFGNGLGSIDPDYGYTWYAGI